MKAPDNVKPFPLVIGLILFAAGTISVIFSLQTSFGYDPSGGYHSSWTLSALSCLVVGISGILIGFAFGGTRLFIVPLCTAALGAAGFFVIQYQMATSYTAWAEERYGVSMTAEDSMKTTAGDTIRFIDGRTAQVTMRDGKIFLALESDAGVELPRHSLYSD